MNLILTQDVEKLGQAGEVVKVKAGYGRNYLLPRGMAMLATEGRVKQLEHQRRVVEDRVRKEVAGHELVAKQLEGLSLDFEVKVGAEGKLFGSVTNADVAARLLERSFSVERRRIELGEPIKQVGEYDVKVKLHREVSATLRVNVFGDGVPVEVPAEEPQDPEEAAFSDDEADDDSPV